LVSSLRLIPDSPNSAAFETNNNEAIIQYINSIRQQQLSKGDMNVITNNDYVDFDHLVDNSNALIIYFKSQLSNEKEIEWKTLYINGNLYVDIPSNLLPDCSRDSFISLLEFAEDRLDCKRIFICLKKSATDRCKSFYKIRNRNEN
jgi:hypothetical protein